MSYSIEIVDELVQKANVSYKLAKEALDHADGHLLDALIYLEDQQMIKNNFPDQMVKTIKKWINDGMVSQIKIIKDDMVILDIPVIAGALISVKWTTQTLIGIMVAIASECDVKIVKRDGAECNFTKVTGDKIAAVIDFFKKEKNKLME